MSLMDGTISNINFFLTGNVRGVNSDIAMVYPFIVIFLGLIGMIMGVIVGITKFFIEQGKR